MTLEELIRYAKENKCSDIHITVGTALAIRRFGQLQILEPAPSAEESRDMIFSILCEELGVLGVIILFSLILLPQLKICSITEITFVAVSLCTISVDSLLSSLTNSHICHSIGSFS